ncbi:MAG: SDR family oxidoreductase [Polyangiaceae bacterium]
MRLKTLREQVIVITGASSGIGLATARKAACAGAKVVLAARTECALASIVRALTSDGAEATSFVVDVADREQVEALARATIERYGRIDTWVNNAGVCIYGRLDEVDERDSRRLFEVNFWGVVHGSLVALPWLRRAHGALINMGSDVADVPMPLQGMYAASKNAVRAFTDTLRIEVEQCSDEPVAITLVEPAGVDTPLPQHARNYMRREPKVRGPVLAAEDVAAVILDAAEHRHRCVRVGRQALSSTLLSSALRTLAPEAADRMAAKQIPELQYDESPRRPQGILHAPNDTEFANVEGSGPFDGPPSFLRLAMP